MILDVCVLCNTNRVGDNEGLNVMNRMDHFGTRDRVLRTSKIDINVRYPNVRFQKDQTIRTVSKHK